MFLKDRIGISAFLLGTICLITFFPVLFASYIQIDDPQHFFNNRLILNPSPNPLQAFFFTPDNVNRTYVPLTLWSFYVELLIFKANPFVSHLINLLLHYMVVFFVMTLGRRLGLSLKGAFTAAFIFAVHPMHVESVAWVTERKDVLYSFFYLAALISYHDYIDKKSGGKYVFALVAAALSVFAKPMALSLPWVLLLVDLFKGRKFSWSMLLDKIPFFCVVEPVAFITYSMNARGTEPFNFFSPFILIWCLVFYIQKFFFPADVSFFFYKAPWPVWEYQPQYALAAALFAVIVVCLFLFRRNRWLMFAFFFYAASTFFLWRIDENDAHFVADRFMYLPSMGFCFLFGYLIEKIMEKDGLQRTVLTGCVLLLGLTLMGISFKKAQAWHSTFSMYMEVDRKDTQNFEIARALGICLRSDWCITSSCADIRKVYFSDQGKFGPRTDACGREIRTAAQILSMKRLKSILAVYPGNVQAIIDVGGLYWEWGGYEKAIAYFQRSTAILPYEAGGYYMLALCYEGKKDLQKAGSFLDKALSLDPQMVEAYVARSRTSAATGDRKKAVMDALKVVELRPHQEYAYDHAIGIFEKLQEPGLVMAVNKMKRKAFFVSVLR